VASMPSIRVVGLGSKSIWCQASEGEAVDISNMSGVVDFSPPDQVVTVRAGTTIDEIQAVLAPEAQCLPFLRPKCLGDGPTTIGGELSLNLPHALEGECGSWRDWVLGMTLVRADGVVAKSGSHAVKSVAGYDVHKLAIGARGWLFVVAEVILRTYPLRSLPHPSVVEKLGDAGDAFWIQRTPPADFALAAMAPGTGCDIQATSTLIRQTTIGTDFPRFEGDWVMASDRPISLDPAHSRFMARAKFVFDPTGKLNRGEWPAAV
jgi:hypothetical protein